MRAISTVLVLALAALPAFGASGTASVRIVKSETLRVGLSEDSKIEVSGLSRPDGATVETRRANESSGAAHSKSEADTDRTRPPATLIVYHAN